MNARNLVLALFVIFVWSSNSVIVKITVSDIPPIWAAFLRFLPTLPFIYLFIRKYGAGIRVHLREFAVISMSGGIMFLQIFTFNLGARYTTGGRVTLIIFSYPLIIALIAPLFLKNEKFNKTIPLGAIISLVGLMLALHKNIGGDLHSHALGDAIEIVSSVLAASNVIFNKWLCNRIDKWKVLFWRFVTACLLFLIFAYIFETLTFGDIRVASWQALAYQSFGVSIFCFIGWQYLLARHNSAKISSFFFAGPVIGMVLGITLLGELFDPWLLVGCVMVGCGIYLVNR